MKGSVSQLGMRRLRKSVTIATAKTKTVGHHAIDCRLMCKFNFCLSNEGIAQSDAIPCPNRKRRRKQ